MSQKKKNFTTIAIRFSEAEAAYVKHAAKLRHLPLGEFIRRAINEELRRQGVDAVLLLESGHD